MKPTKPKTKRIKANQFVKVSKKIITIKPLKAWAVVVNDGSFLKLGDLARPKYVLAIFMEKEHALEKIKNVHSWSVVPVTIKFNHATPKH